MPSRRGSSDVLESFQSIRLNSPQWKVSPAMSTLQGYYGLKTPNHKSAEEGTEMAVYRTDRARYLEDEELPRSLSVSDPPPSRHRKSRSLVNGFLPENGELAEDMPVAEAGEVEADKSGEKSVRRRQKVEAGSSSRTPERLLKDDNSNGSGFLAMIGKGLALRPKSASRTSLAADADSWWLNPIPVGLGDSLIADGFAGVRKSSSTSNLQEQDHNSSSSLWPTSKWSLRPDVQAGLPKPITGRRNKAALD
ncbi:hypothetical protein HHK36_014577 [Tetracentron sinense]|uniref:Uncharacterized protein n=1 Tax=Tetracentron sinense TaxID=13715 RepID=A0A834Z1K3_TETSI|nr:hypothetical protein HHK36_014577 [Tetracentron sinense]